MSELRKKHITELRRALRAHAIEIGDVRIAYKRSELTAHRLMAALSACRDAAGSGGFATAFDESDTVIRKADMDGFTCWSHAKNEMQRIAVIVGASLPKKLTR